MGLQSSLSPEFWKCHAELTSEASYHFEKGSLSNIVFSSREKPFLQVSSRYLEDQKESLQASGIFCFEYSHLEISGCLAKDLGDLNGCF